MTFLALFLIFLCFIKTFYYGMYEIQQKQNKPGGIAVLLLAILRTCISDYYYFYDIYYVITQNAIQHILIYQIPRYKEFHQIRLAFVL